MQPLKMQPVFKHHLWGGTAFKDIYGKYSGDETASEAWEISAHKNGTSIVANGDFAGEPFTKVIDRLGRLVLGDYVMQKYNGEFPLLVKLLDCNSKLSVQVHPNDEYAQAHAGEFGKTEMWYILYAKPGAKLVYGFREDTNRNEVQKAVDDNTLCDMLNFVDVQAGDTFFVDAGIVHALYEGILIAEIQQSSDTTYRLFDHNRNGIDGKPRQLHISQSLDVVSYKSSKGMEKVLAQPVKLGENTVELLAECEQFVTERYGIKEKIVFESKKQTFDTLIFYDGNARIEYEGGSIEVKMGDSVVIPAYLGAYIIVGACSFLKSFVPSD